VVDGWPLATGPAFGGVMAAYHDNTLVRRFSKLLEETDEFPDWDLDKIEEDIVRPMMNVGLSRYFTTDLTTIPAQVTSIASMLVAGYALHARLSAESPNTSTIADSLIKDAKAQLKELLKTPASLAITFKTVTETDKARNRVRFASPRSKPVFGYPTDLVEDDPLRGR
jgi:hypothetical protein